MTPQSLLTTADLAQWLKMNPDTLKRWRGLGEGPGWVMVGGGVRYQLAEVEAWLASRRGPTGTTNPVDPIAESSWRVLSVGREGSNFYK